MMMAIAAVVPHYLLGLAAGAGLLGVFMPVAGYIIPVDSIPDPVWRYPMHYLGYHTYAMHGMMINEFKGTDGWHPPCEIQPTGCPDPVERITGEGVRPSSLLRNVFAVVVVHGCEYTCHILVSRVPHLSLWALYIIMACLWAAAPVLAHLVASLHVRASAAASLCVRAPLEVALLGCVVLWRGEQQPG
jgi:hypothetical protein